MVGKRGREEVTEKSEEREKRTMHQKRARPGTMPAHTQTRRAEDKHTDRQTSATTQRWVFRPPEFSCPRGSPYRMASTAHQTRAQERNSPSHRAGCLPARSLASVLCRLNVQSVSPFIESVLLHQIPPASQQGLGFTLDFPVLPEHRCCYLSFPSVLEVFSSPGQGILDEPPTVMRDVRIPEQEERRPPRQCNSPKGKFIADSSQGSCRIQRSGAGSESPEPKLLHKFIG